MPYLCHLEDDEWITFTMPIGMEVGQDSRCLRLLEGDQVEVSW